jgi:hypothetical protein
MLQIKHSVVALFSKNIGIYFSLKVISIFFKYLWKNSLRGLNGCSYPFSGPAAEIPDHPLVLSSDPLFNWGL